MFINPEQNLEYAMNLWHGKPSGRLMWSLDAGGNCLDRHVEKLGCTDVEEFLQKELGCLMWGGFVVPFELHNDYVEVEHHKDGETDIIEYRSPAGKLREAKKNGQLIEYKVKSEKDLQTLIKIWENTAITLSMKKFTEVCGRSKDKWPVMPCSGVFSSVQHMLQYEMGIENFWYLYMDNSRFVEEAMDLWESQMDTRYKFMEKLPAECLYQAENTSTTMVSPAFYEKYSLKHIRRFADIGRNSGKRTLVHMCGLLKDLMPLIRQTGINGIHSLTPPDTGNTSFEYAYEIMPEDSFILGRFGSTLWLDKGREEILSGLSQILHPGIIREKAFALLVTADAAPEVSLDNLHLLRDCINEYEEMCLNSK